MAYFFLLWNRSHTWIKTQTIDTIQKTSWKVMMYHLRRNIFPARATYTPPFRSRGMTGNHPLNHTPSTWNVDGGFPQGIFYQTVWNLSNKLVSPTTQKTGSPQTARLVSLVVSVSRSTITWSSLLSFKNRVDISTFFHHTHTSLLNNYSTLIVLCLRHI